MKVICNRCNREMEKTSKPNEMRELSYRCAKCGIQITIKLTIKEMMRL